MTDEERIALLEDCLAKHMYMIGAWYYLGKKPAEVSSLTWEGPYAEVSARAQIMHDRRHPTPKKRKK